MSKLKLSDDERDIWDQFKGVEDYNVLMKVMGQLVDKQRDEVLTKRADDLDLPFAKARYDGAIKLMQALKQALS